MRVSMVGRLFYLGASTLVAASVACASSAPAASNPIDRPLSSAESAQVGRRPHTQTVARAAHAPVADATVAAQAIQQRLDSSISADVLDQLKRVTTSVDDGDLGDVGAEADAVTASGRDRFAVRHLPRLREDADGMTALNRITRVEDSAGPVHDVRRARHRPSRCGGLFQLHLVVDFHPSSASGIHTKSTYAVADPTTLPNLDPASVRHRPPPLTRVFTSKWGSARAPSRRATTTEARRCAPSAR